MKNKSKLSSSFISILTLAIFSLFSSCKDEPINRVSPGIRPMTVPYELGTNDPQMGPVHYGFEHYLWDSIGSVISWNALSVSAQANRYHDLLITFD